MSRLYDILNDLANGRLYSGTKQFSGTWTIGSNGYVKLGTLTDEGTVLSVTLFNWSANTGAFSVVLSANNAYLVGTPSVVITEPTIQFLYTKQ